MTLKINGACVGLKGIDLKFRKSGPKRNLIILLLLYIFFSSSIFAFSISSFLFSSSSSVSSGFISVFPSNTFPFPLHNLPLGNTIYVFESGLDDSNNNAITKKDAERITNEIKKWLENDYQNYENTFAQPIKIRVIIPGLPNYADPQTIAERQDLNDEVLSAAILLEIEKLKEMRSDFYNDIWPIILNYLNVLILLYYLFFHILII